MANGLANNFWIVPILFQYLGALPALLPNRRNLRPGRMDDA